MSLDLIFPNFETLIRTPEDVARLNEAILQLAVQGKLVPQDPADEPASELLKRIRAERQRLVKEGELREEKAFSLSRPGKEPFDLPFAWIWVALAELSPEFQNGSSKRESASTGEETIVLRLADVVNGEIALDNTRRFRMPEAERQKYDLQTGDVLITRVNGSVDLIGSFTPVRVDHGWSYCDHFIRMRVDQHLACLGYLVITGKSRLLREQIKVKFITTAGQKTVNQTHIATLLLPLPPLAEQRRIVAKIESLFAQTRALEAKLRQAEELRRKLVEAVLHSAFS